MRILIHDYAGHPFQVQLSRELARRGYRVLHLYYSSNNTPKGNLQKCEKDPETLLIEGLDTRRPISKYRFLQRWLQEWEYGFLLRKRVKAFAPDIVVSANTPLDAQRILLNTTQDLGAKFVYWLQDLNGVAASHLLREKIPLIGGWIGQYFLRLERNLLRKSDRIVAISDAFIPRLKAWGIDAKEVTFIPNWAPLEELPVNQKPNAWAARQGLQDTFCFMYTGGLGLKHNPDLLYQLSVHYQDQERIKICVIAEGPGAEWLKERKQEQGLSNLVLMGYQPYEDIPEVMGTGDVLIAILEEDAGKFSVPSKVLSYLCAQKPLLLAVPPDNLAANIVRDHQAGLVVPPLDQEAFLNAADKLLRDQERRTCCGVNARRYAATYFNIRSIGDEFESIF
jgi:glycosyltransferase involved in cell wall biosynthesis